MAMHPGPNELATEKLTRNELAAMIEHVLYRADANQRATLARLMPDAYQRLTGATDENMESLTARK